MQWLLIIAVVAIGLRILFRPVPEPERRPDSWRSWEGFYALSYSSVTRRATGANVSPELLKKHIAALRSAGYNAITPDDLRRYLDREHALPEKPLLLMFEGGRKDTILNVTPLLRESGFIAVACVNTGACESGDRFYLTGAELRDVAHQPHWYLGSMGHRAMSTLGETRQSEGDAHFLTSRRLDNGVTEDDTAFVIRVMQDYSTSANFLGNMTGNSPALFLYPYADRGVGRGADPLAGRVNRMGVEVVYRLAFVDAHDPFNGPTRDRYALTRLRVDGRMTASDLLERLSQAKPPRRSPGSPIRPADWIFSPKARESGVRVDGVDASEKLRLPEATAAWIRGSEDWSNSEINGTVQFAPGAIAGIYARYSGPEQCLYLSLSATGIRLQERSKPGEHVTLLDHKTALEAGRDYRVRLIVKGNRVSLFLEGHRVGEPLPLTTFEGRGRSGIGSNGGTSTFSAVSAGPLPTVFVVGNQYRTLPASVRESALAFLPNLAVTEKEPGSSEASFCLEQQQVDEMMAAASEGVEPIPVVITAASRVSVGSPCTVTGDLAGLKPIVRRSGVHGLGVFKPYALPERPLAPVRVLRADQVREWLSSSKNTRHEVILVQGDQPEVLRAIDLLLVRVPPQHLVAGSVRLADLPPGVGIVIESGSSK